jgi:hypothetical protein
MQTYRELIHLVQAKFNGPSAVSLRLCVRWFEPGFVETFRTAERGFRELDRIDGAVRETHRRLHRALEARSEAQERERIQAEKDLEMVRIRHRHAVAARPVSRWLRQRLGQTVGGLAASGLNRLWSGGTARELKTEIRRLRKRLSRLRTEIAEGNRETFAEFEAEVAGICLELIEHDRMFLQHLYHRFGLEVESIVFTVASGRILDMLADAGEAGRQARAALGLDPLGCGADAPCSAEEIRSHIREDPDLVAYVGLGPEAVLEGTLEAFVRIKLLTGRVTLPGYDRNWVAHLPPPGEFGRAQAVYGHFPHQLSWLKRPLPGMQVAANGLVTFDDAPEEARSAAPAAAAAAR